VSAVERADVVGALGPVDDLTVAEIVGIGATREDLAEACGWIERDEALMSIQPLARGRVSRLIEIIAALREAEEEEEPN
jgi:hypothetical protein